MDQLILSRRDFLKASAATGAAVTVHVTWTRNPATGIGTPRGDELVQSEPVQSR